MNLTWTYTDLIQWIQDGCDPQIAIQVTELNCSKNQLTYLPPEIGQLTNLKELYCYTNELTRLPPEIGQLRHLQRFNCNNNQLTSLPPEIGQLINLREFHCTNNQLTSLPAEIGQLIKLEDLMCFNNLLTSLPPEIVKLNSACQIYFDDLIKYIPPNIQRFFNRDIYVPNVNDRKNSHNHHIPKSFNLAINYILSVQPTLTQDQLLVHLITNEYLNNQTRSRLLDYLDNQYVHSQFQVTIGELLLNVYSMILSYQDLIQKKIFEILNQEINQTFKCLTHHLFCLVNVLSGFDNHIQINISDAMLIMSNQLCESKMVYKVDHNCQLMPNVSLEYNWLCKNNPTLIECFKTLSLDQINLKTLPLDQISMVKHYLHCQLNETRYKTEEQHFNDVKDQILLIDHFNQPLNQLIKDDNLFTNKIYPYSEYYIIADGCGGVSVSRIDLQQFKNSKSLYYYKLFNRLSKLDSKYQYFNNYSFLEQIKDDNWLSDFTKDEIGSMRIFYNSWFEVYPKFTKEDVIAEIHDILKNIFNNKKD